MDLDGALHDAQRRYVAARPRSRQAAERARRVLPGGNTRSVLHVDPFAFRVAAVDGPYLIDLDGHRVLDLLGDYSAGLLGHRPPAVVDAVTAVLDGGWATGAIHENETAFAEAVVARFPSIEQVRFTNSGTEANLMAVMTARHITGRDRVVVFDGGYHGGVLYFGSSGAPLRAPFEYAVLDYNDTEAVDAEFAANAERIACVLVEPMLGASGCIPGDPTFLARVRALTADAGALLIFDEVMTSRLALGGAQQLLAVTPDVTALGKYLAGGMTFGAFGGSRAVMAAFDPDAGGVTHGGTFNNNALTMAAGAAVHDTMLTAEALADVNARGDRLRARLTDLFAQSSPGWSISGLGSLSTIHPVPGPVRTVVDARAGDDRWRSLLFHELLHEGFYLAPRGYLALGIDVHDGHVDAFVAAVTRVLDRF